MTPQQFIAWQGHMGYGSNSETAMALGVSEPTVENYRRGSRSLKGAKVVVEIPKAVELACAALALGIKAYSGPS